MSTIAETTRGPIQGRIKDDVLLFSGVPYAKPPVGTLRFKPPQPMDSWSEVRLSTRFSPAAPQLPGGGMTDNAPVRWSEDCLYLNICTPAADNKKRPVFFWIHGGAYRTGQGAVPWYNGAKFATQGDIVVVSINYRLGALGFTDLSRFGDEYETSGANGTLDQIAALRWVRENIANFGGDPEQITVAGESAGAFSVTSVMSSPLAQGMMKRAIPQSGAGQHVVSKAAAQKVTDRFLELLNAATIDELASKTAEEILDVQSKIELEANKIEGLGTVAPFYPSIGNSVLPVSPLDAIKDGAAAEVEVLLGTNKDESTLFQIGEFDEARLKKSLARIDANESVLAAYKAAYPDATPTDLAIQLQTDHSFRIPALRVAEARAKYTDRTWMYLFAWESRQPGLKATHALEIPFVFNNLDKPGVAAFIGKGESPQALADTMHQAWTQFVKTGDPGWPVYDLETRTTMRFDTESELVNDPDDGKRQAWAGLR